MTSPSPASVEPITVADRERAKELCAKATVGPWLTDYSVPEEGVNYIRVMSPARSWPEVCAVQGPQEMIGPRADADFIAFSRTAIPAYEARVVELEAALAAAKANERPFSDKLAGEVINTQVTEIKRLETRVAASEARATALLEALATALDRSSDMSDKLYDELSAILQREVSNEREPGSVGNG